MTKKTCRTSIVGSVQKWGTRGIAVLCSLALASCGAELTDENSSQNATTATSSASLLPTGTVGVKWHPGHYVHIMAGDLRVNGWTVKEAYAEMALTPAIKGIQVRFNWSDIEKSKDVYDFSLFDDHLSKLSTGDKRLIILLQTKTFGTTAKLVPDYVLTPEYEGGIFPFGNEANGSKVSVHKGNAMKLWNANVRARLLILINKLGERYNLHTHFEGMGIGETAMGKPLVAVSNAQESQYYSAHLTFQQQMRVAFPNTMTTQFTNYPRSMLPVFVESLKNMGASLGGPDILIDDPGLNAVGTQYTQDGIYHHYPELSGIVPLAPSVMSSNYEETIASGAYPSRKPSITELLKFAHDNLKANYLFWSREPRYFPQVLSKLKSTDSNVQLFITCPSAYGTCITN